MKKFFYHLALLPLTYSFGDATDYRNAWQSQRSTPEQKECQSHFSVGYELLFVKAHFNFNYAVVSTTPQPNNTVQTNHFLSYNHGLDHRVYLTFTPKKYGTWELQWTYLKDSDGAQATGPTNSIQNMYDLAKGNMNFKMHMFELLYSITFQKRKLKANPFAAVGLVYFKKHIAQNFTNQTDFLNITKDLKNVGLGPMLGLKNTYHLNKTFYFLADATLGLFETKFNFHNVQNEQIGIGPATLTQTSLNVHNLVPFGLIRIGIGLQHVFKNCSFLSFYVAYEAQTLFKLCF